jgi:hypothetical protein
LEVLSLKIRSNCTEAVDVLPLTRLRPAAGIDAIWQISGKCGANVLRAAR